jgi:hypothetical protein
VHRGALGVPWYQVRRRQAGTTAAGGPVLDLARFPVTRKCRRSTPIGTVRAASRLAIFPWVRNLIGFYGAGDLVGIRDFPHVTRTLEAFVGRPAVARGIAIPKRVSA